MLVGLGLGLLHTFTTPKRLQYVSIDNVRSFDIHSGKHRDVILIILPCRCREMTGRRSCAEAWSIYLKRAQADLKAHTLLVPDEP